jgi:hypothetical protein
VAEFIPCFTTVSHLLLVYPNLVPLIQTFHKLYAAAKDSGDPLNKMAETFTMFPLLPYDIRFSIWEQTFLTRVLRCKYITDHKSPFSCYRYRTEEGLFVLSQPIGGRSRIMVPCLPLQPDQQILALSVCQESRDFALKAGYRKWSQPTHGYTIGNVYWNPLYDVVFLPEGHQLFRRLPLFDFLGQYGLW